MEPKTLSVGAKAGIAIAIVAVLAVGGYFIFSGNDSTDIITDSTATTTITDEGETTFCTMDARMCPDGSYVGRTGPNCQFVCPNGGSVDDVQGSDNPADLLK